MNKNEVYDQMQDSNIHHVQTSATSRFTDYLNLVISLMGPPIPHPTSKTCHFGGREKISKHQTCNLKGKIVRHDFKVMKA